MNEETGLNPVLKPTNKWFKFIDGWMVELEESTMKLKVTHKSGHFMFKTWAGINSENVFNTWSAEEELTMGLMFNSVKVIIEHGLFDMSLMAKLIKTFTDHYGELETQATDEEHDIALDEVKEEYEAQHLPLPEELTGV